MRKKAITMECDKCDLMKINSDNQMICHWGKGVPKLMEPQKGKKPLPCRLKR